MKSAYELAMERLKESDPDAVVTLSEEQKKALADIDAIYKAKVAEREVFLNKKLTEALKAGNGEDAEQLKTQLRNERLRLEEEKESRKEEIRRGEDS